MTSPVDSSFAHDGSSSAAADLTTDNALALLPHLRTPRESSSRNIGRPYTPPSADAPLQYQYVTSNAPNTSPISSNHAASYTPLEEFTLFPKLPLELRIMIWKLIPRTQRRVVLNSCIVRDRYNGRVLVFSSNTPPPGILRVNKESRAVGLNRYDIIVRDSKRSGCRIYVDYEVDVVVFPDLLNCSEVGYHQSLLPGLSGRKENVFKSIKKIELNTDVANCLEAEHWTTPSGACREVTRYLVAGGCKSLRTLVLESGSYARPKKITTKRSEAERFARGNIMSGLIKSFAKIPSYELPVVSFRSRGDD
ncbi:hypothetical protein VTL71DRAFT_15807 [Oculimacula yallundae]|uniref:2EXR domain-containing protein n=1 Tax=Oculimacula yallundae TaxID=86028 RepID=A0ABR4CES6_9HELO